MKRMIYLAAPLFSEAEKSFNKQLKLKLSPHFDIYLPQEDGMLIVDLIEKGISFQDASQMIFKADVRAINNSDILLIILDGRTVDEGAAMELGYAFSKGKRCIGYSTDPRCLLQYGQNPMISCCLETTVHSVQELYKYLLQSCEVKNYAHNFDFVRSKEKDIFYIGKGYVY